jgi:hypothetical protein
LGWRQIAVCPLVFNHASLRRKILRFSSKQA